MSSGLNSQALRKMADIWSANLKKRFSFYMYEEYHYIYKLCMITCWFKTGTGNTEGLSTSHNYACYTKYISKRVKHCSSSILPRACEHQMMTFKNISEPEWRCVETFNLKWNQFPLPGEICLPPLSDKASQWVNVLNMFKASRDNLTVCSPMLHMPSQLS